VIDALVQELFNRPFDHKGKTAARGEVREAVLAKFLRGHFFGEAPPKTAGREEFGRTFARQFLKAFGSTQRSMTRGERVSLWKQSAIATATALTTGSIIVAIKRFVLPSGRFSEVIASGGGTRNTTLMSSLARDLRTLGLTLRSSDEFGIPSETKEAVAFAVLAYETWIRRPSNVPAATGATRAAVLGKISCP